MVDRASHDDLVSLGWSQSSRAGLHKRSATLDILSQTASLHQVTVSNVDASNAVLAKRRAAKLVRFELATSCRGHLGRSLGQHGAEVLALSTRLVILAIDHKQRVLRQRLVLQRVVHRGPLIEVHRLVEPVVLCCVHCRTPLLLLTHLDSDMVQLLHPQELTEILFAFFLVVLQVVDILEPEVL